MKLFLSYREDSASPVLLRQADSFLGEPTLTLIK
jgi:hypothetical protein